MAEVLHLAHFSISDRQDLKEVDDDRDAAFPPLAALANQSQNATARRLDELKLLLRQVGPPVSILLRERDELWGAPKMLWGIGVRSLAMPVQLDPGVERFR